MTWFPPPYEEITSQKPMDHLHSRPLCFASSLFCPGESPVTPRLLKILKYSMGQLGITQAILVTALVIADINGKYSTFSLPLKFVALASVTASVYSCNVLVKITSNLIPERNMLNKSRSIFIMIVWANLQDLALTLAAQYGAFPDDPTYNGETKAQLWNSVLQLGECFLFAILMTKYWPMHENTPEPAYLSVT